jgi:hypothetical protein
MLRGQTSRRLDTLLVLNQSPEPNQLASDVPLPPDVNAIAFNPIFNFTLAAHGHVVNPGTGVVTVAAALPGGAVEVPNFIISARVTHTSREAPKPLSIPIRVHIHQAVTKIWLTPNPLTVRMGSSRMRFTVLAEFNDRTVGDITFHPCLTWASSLPSVAVNADGILTATVAGAEPNITVTLPADLGGGSATAKVKTDAAWPVGLLAQLVPGSPGTARRNEVPNILFIPEGFLSGEKAAFEVLLQKLVNEIAAGTTTFPFNVLRPNMNYWSIFLPSRERGGTVSNGLRYLSRGAEIRRMEALPVPVPPGALGIQSVQQLLFQVGLPVPANIGANFATMRASWTTLYGAAHLNGLTQPIFDAWRDLADYTLAFDHDTALGLRTGLDRPQVSMPGDDGRVLWLNRFRVSRQDFQPMITALVSSDTGEVIGDLWGSGKKDEALTFVLAAGPHRSGGAGRPPDGIIAGSLREESEIRVRAVADSVVVETVPYSIPGTPSVEVRTMIVHETAHTLHLGDEYGTATLDLPGPNRLDGFWNLQTEASALDPGTAIDGNLIHWNWPRISKVAVLAAKPIALGGANFRLILQPGHGSAFNVNDSVRLRRRPLSLPQRLREPLVIEQIIAGPVSDEVQVRFTSVFPPLNVDDYPAGALVYLPTLHPTLGTELSLVWDGVRDHITATGFPLNRVVQACARDEHQVQPVINLPDGLPPTKPLYTSWLIGIYDGGAESHCGVFHPAGACLMRALRVPRWSAKYPGSPYRFCAVCRYILVDLLDPTLHPLVDAEYSKFYPIP